MRCPHCAGEIPDRSIFCGICGGRIEPADRPTPAPAPGASLSPSLFELPVSRRARLTKLFAVLALDAVLAIAGIAMIVSYLRARDEARQEAGGPAEIERGEAQVEIGAPVVAPSTPRAAREPAPTGRPGEAGSAKRRNPGSASSARESSGPTRDPEPARPAPKPERPAPETAEPGVEAPGEGGAGEGTPGEGTAGEGTVDETDSDPDLTAEEAAAKASRMKLLTHRVKVVVDKNRGQFQRCYRLVAKAAGPVQGKVVIRFQVMPDGKAKHVRATVNETGSSKLAGCLVSQFESWTFPTHEEAEPIDFMWPIDFKAPA